MLAMSDGAGLIGLGGRPETQEVPRADEIRPRATRIVGQPKTISAENDMICDDHVSPIRLAATRGGRRRLKESPPPAPPPPAANQQTKQSANHPPKLVSL